MVGHDNPGVYLVAKFLAVEYEVGQQEECVCFFQEDRVAFPNVAGDEVDLIGFVSDMFWHMVMFLSRQ